MNILILLSFLFLQTGNTIKINDAWVRPGLAQMGTALYFEIENTGDSADTLYKVESDIAGRIELHETYTAGDVMGMKEVENIIVEPGSFFKLKPGAHHIMVMKLKKDINKGDEVKFSLFFTNAGKIEITSVCK